MVDGVRGPGGGYQLSREASDINIAEIVAAVDETIDSTRCGGKANCRGAEPCLTHELWMGLSEQIRQYLSTITLADVIQQRSTQDLANNYQENVEVMTRRER